MKTALNDTDGKPITCAGPARFELPCREWFLSTSSSSDLEGVGCEGIYYTSTLCRLSDSCKSGHLERKEYRTIDFSKTYKKPCEKIGQKSAGTVW